MSEAHHDIGERLALRFMLTCIGGTFAFFGYLGSALLLETKVIPHLEPPKFTYGQQFAIAFLNKRRFRGIAVALIAIAIVGSLVTLNLWRGDGIGACNSAIVLYYPIFGLCSLVGTIGLFLYLAGVFGRHSELANKQMHRNADVRPISNCKSTGPRPVMLDVSQQRA